MEIGQSDLIQSRDLRAQSPFEMPEASLDSGHIRLQLALSHLEAREFREAMNFAQLAANDPECSDEANSCILQALIGLGHLREGMQLGQDMFQRSPKLETALRVAGLAYQLEKDKLAQEYYEHALEKQPSPLQLFVIFKNLGNISVRANELSKAESYYDRADIIDPKSALLRVNRATLYLQRGNLEKAVILYREAVVLDADLAAGWIGLAIVHRQMGDLRLAWGNIERALDIDPKSRVAIRLLIEWSVADRRLPRAIERAQEYMRYEFEDAEVGLCLAKMMIEEDQLQAAAVEIERVLTLDPGFEEAQKLQAILQHHAERDVQFARE